MASRRWSRLIQPQFIPRPLLPINNFQISSRPPYTITSSWTSRLSVLVKSPVIFSPTNLLFYWTSRSLTTGAARLHTVLNSTTMFNSSTINCSKTVKTRLFIISDTHDGFQYANNEPYSKNGSFRPPLPKSDVLIHSGDLTMVGTMQQYRSSLKMLSKIEAELKLVIAGNHDLSLQENYYLHHPKAKAIAGTYYDESCPEQARELWTGQEAKEAGVTYLTEGMHTFELSNGAIFTVFASPWQPVFYDWAFNYPKNEDRWNPPHLVDPTSPITPGAVPAPQEQDPHPIPENAKVDIMITHGPPYMHLDKCYDGYDAGCAHLLKALERVRPQLHCFGHIHEAWGAEVVTWKRDDEQAGPGPFGEKSEILGSLEKSQKPEDSEVTERRGAFADVSSQGPRPLQAGKETLLVNSCIMDLRYKANGAGWLVDMDLPAK